jgi:3-deoxy-manno-octulosonate cytidylyltransferase (CMP-KDO synthetase)
VRVAERAAKSGASRVIVATDDARIANAVNDHGHEAMLTRSDHATGTDRLAEVATKLRLAAGAIIVNVQGDEPLIAPALIRRVAENLATHRKAAIATAACPIRDARDMANPNVVKVVLDEEGHALYFSRAPIPYARDAFAMGIRALPAGLPALRHLGIYAYRCSFLRAYSRLRPAAIERAEALEQLRALAHGYRISVTVTSTAPHPGVDTTADLQRLRRLLRR